MEPSMMKWIKITIVIMLFHFLSGCGSVVKYLDTAWYTGQEREDSKTLPPLEIPPELSGSKTPENH